MSNVQIAQTILQQLGGNQFIAMTGAKNFTAIENGLSFKIGKNSLGANSVKIVLNSMDTYDITYSRWAKKRNTYDYIETVKMNANGLYNDMIRKSFEEATGLYASL